MPNRFNKRGYSLIELIVVIVVLAIVTTTALRSMRSTHDATRMEQTRDEMRRLAVAIVGDIELRSGLDQTDYGYVGDIGALPPNLDALVLNPGFATWKGPYLKDALTNGGGDVDYKYDAWGVAYAYSGGSTIVSTGSGSTLTWQLAPSTAALLSNTVAVHVFDLDHSAPGTVYDDSIRVRLVYPNGSGGLTAAQAMPRPDGSATFTGIPMGVHTLEVIHLPAADTVRRIIRVESGRSAELNVQWFADAW